MNYKNINNNYCKLSKTSITVKTSNNKTMGVVTNATRFKDLQANKQIMYSKLLRDLGIWGSNKGYIDYTYLIDNKLVLFRNTNSEEYLNEISLMEIENFYNNVQSNGVDVVKIQKLA